jgi:hypothetical protein
VNFDTVELTRDLIGTVNPGLIPAEINHLEIIGSGEKEGFVRDFTITGKGKKRVLITGRRLSFRKVCRIGLVIRNFPCMAKRGLSRRARTG